MPGTSEIILIFLIVLLLFGGKELPRIARSFGKWMSIFQRSMNEVRREFNRISIEEELKEREIQGEEHQDVILKQEKRTIPTSEDHEQTDAIYRTAESEKMRPSSGETTEAPCEKSG